MAIKIILGFIAALIGYFLYKSYTGTSDESTFMRLLSTIFAGVYIGLLGVFYVLPLVSQKAAMSMYSDSNQKADPDLLNEARSLTSQGEYEAAVTAYRKAIIKDPSNRLAWTDMAKLYAEKLEQPGLAAASLREAYDEHEWEAEDAAFLLFRVSEWQIDECQDKEAGSVTLSEIIKTFPDTRHSANAMQKLRELGYEVEVETV